MAFGASLSQNVTKQLADLETEIMLEQKRMALIQTRTATLSLTGAGGQMPQVISLYGSGTKMRALLDLGAAGVRDVVAGDQLGQDLLVASIDVNSGVLLRVGSGKRAGTVALAMKARAIPAASGTPTGPSPLPGLPPGPMTPMGVAHGIVVPPLLPMPANASSR
jgi:hypothetical protein